MSRRGNDLVRRYLWMAALSAVRCNPAVRALYARVVAKHPQAQPVVTAARADNVSAQLGGPSPGLCASGDREATRVTDGLTGTTG